MSKEEKTLEEPLQFDMDFDEALERFVEVNTRDIPETPEGGKANPFVKWAGGKRSLLDELETYMPDIFDDYYEPFAGGGALYFRIHDRLKGAFLSDVILDLIFVYAVIKKDPTKLITQLKTHKKKHSDDYYYKNRSQHQLDDPIRIAARFLYLNKTCYNGLYRVNKKGEFNVPVGAYENPNIVQEENIWLVHKALKKADIKYLPFEKINPSRGDFVYCDPPYHPVNGNSFTSYTRLRFDEKDQIRLRDFALEMHQRGVKIMLSNSNTEFIRDLYKDKPFTVRIVHAPRFVNSKPGGRENVEEVLVTTYG